MEQSFMGLNTRALLMAALAAGAGIGLLSGIPVIACVNCLLFAWVWGGGIGAVYLYRRSMGLQPLTITQGVMIGAAAGVVGAIIGGIISLLLSGLTTAFSAYMNQALGNGSELIPNLLLSSSLGFFGLLGRIILYAVMGAVGGIIATALIWKAPAAPMAPPPYTPPPAGPGV